MTEGGKSDTHKRGEGRALVLRVLCAVHSVVHSAGLGPLCDCPESSEGKRKVLGGSL